MSSYSTIRLAWEGGRAVALVALCLSLGCDRAEPSAVRDQPVAPGYTVSAQGGTPATGPGDRYNHCERIWCLTHRENFFTDHFLEGHVGWVLHDDLHGDVFAPRFRTDGPPLPNASPTALRLCGKHVHPYVFGKGGGPIRYLGYSYSLGYSRAHFNSFGTRIEPCCINGAGSAFVHARSARGFRFHELDEYRDAPGVGWQKPFQARAKR